MEFAEFKNKIRDIATKIESTKNNVCTEEATKNAFIMPFIRALGYDVFDPNEVVPEFTADVGIKQGEKIDYAIFKDGEPIVLIECKKAGVDLNAGNESQLFRYFTATPAKFAILTNGITYKFFTDLDDKNKMDTTPFLSFNILKIKDSHLSELLKFQKESFNFDEILSTANTLKYSNEFRSVIADEMKEPSKEFIKFFIKKVYTGVVTERIIDQFSGLIKDLLSQYINENVNERLEAALNKETKPNTDVSDEIKMPKIITTDEEIEAFHIIRAILCQSVQLDRVYYRDAQSYFAILFDDNNRKTLCRLYLSENKKYIGIMDKNKNEDRILINSIGDIYKHSQKIIEIANFYSKE